MFALLVLFMMAGQVGPEAKSDDRLATLEREVKTLRAEVDALKRAESDRSVRERALLDAQIRFMGLSEASKKR